MKNLLLALLLFAAFACAPKQETVPKTEYVLLVDSIRILNDSLECAREDNVILSDSIEDLLIRPMMTPEQFIQLYKFERLEKYYKICTKNPSQWKYYKGWSSRVFKGEY